MYPSLAWFRKQEGKQIKKHIIELKKKITPDIKQAFFDANGYFASDIDILEWYDRHKIVKENK